MSTAGFRRRLARLDAQILGPKVLLDGLEQTRLDVERHLRHATTCPVSDLPTALTTEIFLWCLATDEDGFEVPSDVVWRDQGMWRMNPHASLALASVTVCRAWRALAFSTPELWSRLEYFLPDEIADEQSEAPEKLRRVTEKITRWFDRAGSRPLTLSLHTGARWEARGDSHMQNSLRHLIHKYSGSIEQLDLDMPQRTIKQLGLDALSLSLSVDNFAHLEESFACIEPTLETLTLGSTDALELLHPHHQTYPYLHRATFPHLYTLNLGNLTGLDYNKLLELLYDRPSIRYLRLSFAQGTFLDDRVDIRNRGCNDVKGHFAELAARGMNVNISTKTKTCWAQSSRIGFFPRSI
ncbi:hypothetical protein B0H17DRAFT_1199505 [Mycena rosella]|uniref:F-box domain-containing protein n=1 Tax=Mycena rosella TaxID=1033263 RepID=A0AAD7DMK3_MYCRO|nr:hypothetical protein B0H17DRAFT_1199505 [Mycena rosella]